MLVLILALALPALFLGFFRSRNLFSRACAFIILDWLLEMVPYGVPAARLPYVMFWLAIGACWSPSIRSMLDSQIFVPDSKRRIRLTL